MRSVSVVTPVRNAAATIERCVRSVCSQQEVEVHQIVQDGASDDGTLEILFRLQKEFGEDHLRIVSEPDAGQADGKNRALARVSDPIFVVFNGDDEMKQGACAAATHLLSEHPDWDAVIARQTDVIDENSVFLRTHKECVDPTFLNVLSLRSVPQFNSIFFRTQLWRDFVPGGLGTDATLRTCPDFEMLLRWLGDGERNIRVADAHTFTRYRCHAGSETGSGTMMPLFVAAKRSLQDRIFHRCVTEWTLDKACRLFNAPCPLLSSRSAAAEGLARWASC